MPTLKKNKLCEKMKSLPSGSGLHWISRVRTVRFKYIETLLNLAAIHNWRNMVFLRLVNKPTAAGTTELPWQRYLFYLRDTSRDNFLSMKSGSVVL